MHATNHLKSVGNPDATGREAKATLKRWLRLGPALVGAAMLGACASAGSDGAADADDPLEPMNRAVFAVNDVLDQVVLRPVSYVYKEALPDPIQDMVRNFLRWLKSPVILANDLLQGDFTHAKVTSARFLVNGALFGVVEAADGLGLPYREEDFGQTLGVHGMSGGAYLMLPLLGPSNVRDTVGLVVDYFIDPLSYLDERGLRQSVGIGRRVTQAVDFRAENFDRIDDLRSDSIDFYAKVRAIYRQQRKAAVNNGVIPIDESTPDLSEEFDRQLPTPEAEAPLSKSGG
ncbi:MAG: VacJ family lipoprotein [Proteobacteria bacterium]|nr:VacJ family lipoprotein [Pseudomonadota bacterium]